ncbi:hypothetical protein HGA34_00515 [Candidatus Falkowbacteria bacterium]|nr:hypothetical protein [Candidatus Falkowbacteria bacterium]
MSDMTLIRECQHCKRVYGCHDGHNANDCIYCNSFSGCNLRTKTELPVTNGICSFCIPHALAAAKIGSTFVHYRELQFKPQRQPQLA